MTESKKESNFKELIYNSENKIKKEENMNKTTKSEEYILNDEQNFEDNITINDLSSYNLIEQINNIEFEDSEDITKLQSNIAKSIKIEN
tara:strand:+ start:2814 stop:3080 length:267 start_codon:yes stop_codon:yes gene_type:complete